MQTLTLPLYSTLESSPEFIPEPKRGLPKPAYKPAPHVSLEEAIKSVIPDQSEENKVLRTRKHLGKIAENLSDAHVETIISEFQFLIDTWMDEYEKEVFSGQTLKEVLNGG